MLDARHTTSLERVVEGGRKRNFGLIVKKKKFKNRQKIQIFRKISNFQRKKPSSQSFGTTVKVREERTRLPGSSERVRGLRTSRARHREGTRAAHVSRLSPGPPPPNPPNENGRATTKRYTAGTSRNRARAPPPTGVQHTYPLSSSSHPLYTALAHYMNIYYHYYYYYLLLSCVCSRGGVCPARTYLPPTTPSSPYRRHHPPCLRARVHARNVILYTLTFVRDRRRFPRGRSARARV